MDIHIHSTHTELTPEEASFRPQTLEQLDQLLVELIRDKKVQGASYLLSRGGKTFAMKSMGELRHTEQGKPFTTDSIRRIASITKWFTMVAVLRLMEEGKLSLGQQVKDFIPEFDHRFYERINITHLLTHTSGLAPDGGYFLEPYPMDWYDYLFAFGDDEDENPPTRTVEEETAFRKSQWIKAMLAGPPVCPPSEQWNYCTKGFIILGEIISRVTGIDYEEYIQRTILEPLGMTRTFFTVPEELHEEVCVINDWEVQRLNRNNKESFDPPRSGGGLFSTLEDLNKFAQMLLNKGTYNGQRILGRKSVEMLSREPYPEGLPAFCWGDQVKHSHFALSSSLGREYDSCGPNTIFHEGAGRSTLMVDPDEDLVVAFFVPSDVDWVPESVINVKNIIWSGLK
jgi:CubicO group peptidase (beta-lactamase class C family)